MKVSHLKHDIFDTCAKKYHFDDIPLLRKHASRANYEKSDILIKEVLTLRNCIVCSYSGAKSFT